MAQDLAWLEIIQFLEPIDVLTSLLTVNRNIHNLIRNSCIVISDDICKFCNGEKSDLNISIYQNAENSNSDHVKLIGNAKYFIRLHLLKLAFKLGNHDPERNTEEISQILNPNELELLNFYRLFFPNFEIAHKDQTINYMILGDSGIGKSTLGTFIQHGKFRENVGIGPYYFSKICTIPNEENRCKHQIWETNGVERFYSKSEMIEDKWHQEYDVKCLFAFSMDHESTFNKLDEWFLAGLQSNNTDTGIVLGLHSEKNYSHYERKPVCLKDAVQKAYEYRRSVFVEIDCKNFKHIYVPVWFIQLQFTFNSFFEKDANEEEIKNWYCSLL
ncbi:predicted protein [Naegleria gruberi]|uniref:Predicted protein n=1 Tax=Naegleria gruberi TaxID=5762 RepID=D2VSG5_NAEGR|nr:uncharacterized protein NAEGRDRAFT_71933 [Naegleria gruberi]EFC40188.1 predicted protein [Naegleria gruberi]|eukprot:XP_002672932.1 predicted protein [Naegleria gruberi strain NEG-M]